MLARTPLAANSELRVALVSGNYNYVRDGANQALNRLVGFLERRGVPVRIYSPTAEVPAFESTGTVVSIPSFGFPGRSEYLVGTGLPRRVRRDILDFAPTLMHLSAPDWLGHRAKAFAMKQGIPTVASVHTRFETYFSYYGMRWLEPLIERQLRRFYGNLAQIYAPSESMAALLREQKMSDNIAIWSRGVDRALFRPERRSLDWRRAHGIADSDCVIGFVGRVVLEKGLDVFADTIAELRSRGMAPRIVVVGEGPAREMITERLPGALFTGHQSGEALARAYASMDVLFNPSVTETFGNVTLEAMASGLPVVAARATGSSSLVEDGVSGRLVEPGAVSAFADALGAYLADPEARRAAGAAGLKRSDRYDWDEINGAMLAHYREVLDGANRAASATLRLAPPPPRFADVPRLRAGRG